MAAKYVHIYCSFKTLYKLPSYCISVTHTHKYKQTCYHFKQHRAHNYTLCKCLIILSIQKSWYSGDVFECPDSPVKFTRELDANTLLVLFNCSVILTHDPRNIILPGLSVKLSFDYYFFTLVLSEQ